MIFDWDAEGWKNFVSDPEVPAILQEAGHVGKPQAAMLAGAATTPEHARGAPSLPPASGFRKPRTGELRHRPEAPVLDRNNTRIGESDDANPIKIGLIAELTGPLSFMGIANANLTTMLVDDINAAGGLLGRRVELIVEDGATTDSVAKAKAAKLVDEDKVDLVVGGIFSSTRQAIKSEAVIGGKTLYIYPEQYEGQESDPLIFCTGPVPAQQVEPLIPWVMKTTGARKFYLPSADYIWPRLLNKAASRVVRANGGEIVGEEYFPLDHTDYDARSRRSSSSGTEVVFNTIVPPGPDARSSSSSTTPASPKRGGKIICTYFDENFLNLVPAEQVEGLYSCLDYYQDVSDPFSRELLDPLRRALPGQRAVDRGQRLHRALPRDPALGGRGEGGGHARPRRGHPRARPRPHRRRAGRAGRNGARPAPRPHEHVHRAGAERPVRDRPEPWEHRSERADSKRRTAAGSCGLIGVLGDACAGANPVASAQQYVRLPRTCGYTQVAGDCGRLAADFLPFFPMKSKTAMRTLTPLVLVRIQVPQPA